MNTAMTAINVAKEAYKKALVDNLENLKTEKARLEGELKSITDMIKAVSKDVPREPQKSKADKWEAIKAALKGKSKMTQKQILGIVGFQPGPILKEHKKDLDVDKGNPPKVAATYSLK